MKTKTTLKAILFLLYLLPAIAFSQNGSKKLTLDDLLKTRTFRSSGINEIRSMKDGLHYTTLSNDYQYISKYAYKSGDSISKIFDLREIRGSDIKMIYDYEFSDDENEILIQSNIEMLYRRSFKADYYIYNRTTGDIKALSSNGMQQLATFSPDGKKVAFVRENNLFIVDIETGKEDKITQDGKFNEIINGAPDWVYEEEFEFNKAFAWSPDSKKLAYLKFDERHVKTFSMMMFQGAKPSIDENILYPSSYQFKYPKAGEDNSIVTVHLYDLSTAETINVHIGEETDQYIPRIKFGNKSDMLVIFRLNRLQNRLELLAANSATGQSKVIYTDTNRYYIDESIFDNLHFLPDEEAFVITSEKDGWMHLYKYDYSKNVLTQLTKGEFDVVNYYGYSAENKLHYFQSKQKGPSQRQIYSVRNDGKSLKVVMEKKGTNDASFSNSLAYFINTHSSVSEPPVYTLHESNGKQIRVLEDNAEMKKRMSEYRFNYRQFFEFTNDGVSLNGYILYPPDFDQSKKYPVIFNQYSGPNSQEVLDRWSFDFDNYLAEEGFVIVTIDPRGTGGRGEAFRKVTYLQLGKYETIDQIAGAKYIASQPWADKNRIGIWGWSYGGFISSLCMLKGENTFAAGVAVAPVTNWRYYDNIYTERFMRKPQDNAEGYDQNSPLFFADKLQGKLLLIHGTADDNVHMQNTAELSERLVQANKQFEQMLYTNRNHSIYGGNTRYHLYTRISNFFKTNL